MKFNLILLILLASTGLLRAQQEQQELEPVIVEGSFINPPLDYPSAFSTVIDLDQFLGEYNTASELLSLSPESL